MKAFVEKETLEKALRRIAAFVGIKSTIPVLQNVLITANAENTTLELLGTDLDNWACTTAECSGWPEAGEVLINFKALQAILKARPKGLICIEHSPSVLQPTLTQGAFSVVLPHGDRMNFPDPPGALELESTVQYGDQFRSVLKMTIPAITTEDGRYGLSNVKMVRKDGNISTIATDGHRLALGSIDVMNPNGDVDFDFLLPAKVAKEILKTTGPLSFATGVTDPPMQMVQTNSVEIMWRTPDSQFPDYKLILFQTEDSTRWGTVDAVALLDALESIESVLVSQNPDTNRDRMAIFQLSSEGCCLLSSATGENRTSVPLAMEYFGLPLTIAFNIRYLKEHLKLHKATSIGVYFHPDESPESRQAIFQWNHFGDNGGDAVRGFELTIMPIRF